MIDLTKFRENADEHGICEEYSERWAECVSKKQLIDLALDVNGTIYLCNALAKGWGLSPEFIEDKFAPFINGRYTCDNGKYSAQMFCNYGGTVNVTTTLLTLINSEVKVYVSRSQICEIHAVGCKNITLYGEGKAVLVIYGGANTTNVSADDKIQLKVTYKRDGGFE